MKSDYKHKQPQRIILGRLARVMFAVRVVVKK